MRVNDPSAGSPTETLLRLLLPLGDKVHETFHSEVLSCREVASLSVQIGVTDAQALNKRVGAVLL